MGDGPERLLEAIRAGVDPPAPLIPAGHATSLTRREREVLSLLAIGLSTKETAESLFLSPRTVDNHAHRIMKKLGLHGRVELARYALREGLVTA
jgi:DNA-binding NarL/FixJ family response regulator